MAAAQIGDQLTAIFQQLQVQGPAGNQAKVFRGEIWENYLEWFTDIEPGQRRLATDALKVERFRNHLKDVALDFFNDLPEETQASWKLVKDSFAARFISKHIHAAYAGALRNRKQMAGEGVSKLLTDLKRLVRTVHMTMPEEFKEQVLRDAFLMALRDDIRRHVEMHTTSLTLKDVYDCALKYEIVSGMQNGLQGTANQGKAFDNKGAGVFYGFRCNQPEPTNPSVNAAGYQGSSQWPPRGRSGSRGRFQGIRGGGSNRYKLEFTDDGRPICAKCNRVGHYRRDCTVGDVPRGASGRGRSQGRIFTRGGSRGRAMRGSFSRGGGGGGSARVNYAAYDEASDQTPAAQPSQREQELEAEVQELKAQNHRYKEQERQRSVNYLSSGFTRSTGLSLGTTVLLTVVLVLAHSTPTDAAINSFYKGLASFYTGPLDIHMCPWTFGSSLWKLPDPEWLRLGRPTLKKNATIRARYIQFHRADTRYNVANGTFCRCTRDAVTVLRDFRGKKNYLNYSATSLPVTEMECHRMMFYQESRFGSLRWDGSSWSTQNTLAVNLPNVPFGCCRTKETFVQNCHLHFANVYQRDPLPTVESMGAELSSSCAYEDGSCTLEDQGIAMWKPRKSIKTCFTADGEPALGFEHKPVAESDQPPEIVWVAEDASRFVTYFEETEPFTVPHSDCKTGISDPAAPSVLYSSSSKSYFSLLDCPGSCPTEGELSNKSRLDKRLECSHLEQLLLNAASAMKHVLASSREALQIHPTSVLQKMTGVWSLSAYVLDNVLRIRPCFPIPMADYELLEPTAEDRQAKKFPVKFLAQREWYFGYLDLKTREVQPQYGMENEDRVSRMLSTWRNQFDLKMQRIIYPLDEFRQIPESWVSLPQGPIPSFALAAWPKMPKAGYTLLSTPDTVKEASDFLAQLLPLDDPYPLGSQHVLALFLCIYVVMAMICIHCCCCYSWYKLVNPMYWATRGIRQKLRNCSKRRYSSPRVRRRMAEAESQLTELVSPSTSSSHTVRRDSLTILDPNGSGKMVKVYQTSGFGSLSATVGVEVNQKERKGLIDTGSQITLVGEEEAEKLGLVVEPNEEDLHGITVTGALFKLSGHAKLDLKIGNRLVKDHTVFIAESPPCPVLMGLDFLEKIGPFLLDFQDRTLHLYTRRPRAASHVLPLGEGCKEWTVYASETTVIPPRCQKFVRAQCDAPGGTDYLFEPAQKLEKYKNVKVGVAFQDVVVGSALLKTSNSTAPLTYMNSNYYPAVVYKGTKLGMVEHYTPFNPRVCMVEQTKSMKARKPHLCSVKAERPTPKDPLQDLDLSKSNLTEDEKVQLIALLRKYQDRIAVDSTDLGCLNTTTHKIDTGDASPINQRPYRTPLAHRRQLEEEVSKLESAGVLRPSTSPWGSPVLLVPKPDGSVRFVVDYREQLQWRLSTAWRKAKENITVAQGRQAYHHDQGAAIQLYQVGDLVLVHRPELIKGRAAKLGLAWTGPYRVTEVLSQQNLLVIPESDPHVLPVRVHCRRVKPFHARDVSNSVDSSDEKDGYETPGDDAAAWTDADQVVDPAVPTGVPPASIPQDQAGMSNDNQSTRAQHRYALRPRKK